MVEISRLPLGFGYQADALQSIRGIKNIYLKIQYLRRLIPKLLYKQRLEAASIIRELNDPDRKAKALVTLTQKFPEFYTEAYEVTKSIESRVQQIKQLSTLAIDKPELIPEIVQIAEEWDITKQSNQSSERQEILLTLAPHLPIRINQEVKRERIANLIISEDLWRRSLYLLSKGYRDALQGGALRNDATQSEDLLDLQDEINALSDLLLMRDLEPPMAAGILGGWGGGKSYIMHLMQARMTELRCRNIDLGDAWNSNPYHEKLDPYVGHIYQIKFDAWTFAKSDLWASLMQTIFFELDRQLTLEKNIENGLRKRKERALYGIEDQQKSKEIEDEYDRKNREIEQKIWPILYKSNNDEREWFLKRVLQDIDLLQTLETESSYGKLWEVINDTQQEDQAKLNQTQDLLEKAEIELNIKRAELRQKITENFEPLIRIQSSQNVQRVDALLGTSFTLLRRRIGPKIFKELNNQIHLDLYGSHEQNDLTNSNILTRL